MKLELDGRVYDIADLADVDLYSLYELKSRWGIGMKSILTTAKTMGDFKDPLDMLENVEAFQTFLAVIWLVRRAAGEKLTLEEANAIPLTKLKFIPDEPAAADPKAETASAPAGKRRGTTSAGKSKMSG